jgi:predicted nucleic acid-binding protein
MISHPRPSAEIIDWVAWLTSSGVEFVVPEIADYEVRRELLRSGRAKGVRRLDQLKTRLTYLPIATDAMLKAAEFWAVARRHGNPTNSRLLA